MAVDGMPFIETCTMAIGTIIADTACMPVVRSRSTSSGHREVIPVRLGRAANRVVTASAVTNTGTESMCMAHVHPQLLAQSELRGCLKGRALASFIVSPYVLRDRAIGVLYATNCARTAHMVTHSKAIPMAVMKGRMMPAPFRSCGVVPSFECWWLRVSLKTDLASSLGVRLGTDRQLPAGEAGNAHKDQRGNQIDSNGAVSGLDEGCFGGHHHAHRSHVPDITE